MQEDIAATSGFISALMSTCLPKHGAIAWISPEPMVFPPALRSFNLIPEEIIFIHPANEKDLLWTTEEALKCTGLRAVIAEMRSLNAMASRRYQLAVEKSKVTGFLINRTKSGPIANNCVSRWRVTTASSISENGLPGIGNPSWEVQLQKIRNGKPGQWTLEWPGQALRLISGIQIPPQDVRLHKLTG
jgi:protein ImuA